MSKVMIDSRINDEGDRIVLWSRGDGIYAIEYTNVKYTFSFEADDAEDALSVFEGEAV